MPGLHIHRSNRLEMLAEALGEVTRTPLRSVFAPEVIVVQSLGMRRWLSLEVARENGIAMNSAFPFPAALVEQLFAIVLPEHAGDPVFSPDLLLWQILGLLPSLVKEPDGAELAHYLQGENLPLKGYQLAGKIARVFDRYLAYRPEFALDWQQGRNSIPHAAWQARLWRELTHGKENTHLPARAREFSARLRAGRFDPAALPERISVFGISSLPPFHMQIFGEAARVMDVHLFTLEPTAEFWSDLRSRKQQDRILRRQRRKNLTSDDLHLETGNALLASLGKIGREFSENVQTLDGAREHDLFEPPQGTSLLAQVQGDIFELRDLLADLRVGRRTVLTTDRSIQIHSCHSPMREVEVLHDQLLALFESDRELTPKEILVTMPDVERYAPFIQAVFGAPEAPGLAIPFTIADRSVRAESCIADAFLTLLDLATSRCGAGSIFALLATRAVRQRFSLEEPDLEIIRDWIARTGIRWGVDGEHRAGFGVPEFEENSWRHGLRRLLLGYALPGDGATLFAGLLPVREVEGGLALTLGRFVDFAEQLFAAIEDFRQARSLAEWERVLRQTMATFFQEDDETADEMRRLRRALEGLGGAEHLAGYGESVPFEVLRMHLAEAFTLSESGIGFLAGRVTFCALKPMRSIPFKVLCLIGMNDGAFPRRDPALAFDLMAQHPRAGDRSLRDDDRQLFLESLLSARKALYISFCGLSPKDNSALPPSVVVSELLDYLNENFASNDGAPCEKFVFTQHRLQPFSPDYFRESGPLFSYSSANAEASRMSQADREPTAAFCAEPIPEPSGPWRDLDWEALGVFLAHPAKFFCLERLGLTRPDEFTPLEDCEPQEIDTLDRYAFEQELTRAALAMEPLGERLPIVRASGQLPAGYMGEAAFHTMAARSAGLAERIRACLDPTPLPALTVDLTLGGFRLTGTLRGLYAGCLLRHRTAKLKPSDLLRAWVSHLVLQLTGSADHSRTTLLFDLEEAWRFEPVDNAAEILIDLLSLYAEGLCRPIPLIPLTSLEFARRTLRPSAKEMTQPIKSARSCWEGNERNKNAEKDEMWLKLCFGRGADPLDEAWKATALRVYRPLLAARTSLKG